MKKGFLALALMVTLAACQQTIPKEALLWQPTSLENRSMQTRRFDTQDEPSLLSASAGVLQDLGYSLDESETPLGLITGSKDRDATEAGQVAGAIVMGVLFGVIPHVDDKQKIRVSVVSKPLTEDGTQHSIRVTFQRVVWNTAGRVSTTELLDDPIIYQQFFEKLSKAVFLEAQSI